VIIARVVTSYEIKKYFYVRTVMRKCTKDPRTCERETYVSAVGDLLWVPSELGYPVAPASAGPCWKACRETVSPFRHAAAITRQYLDHYEAVIQLSHQFMS